MSTSVDCLIPSNPDIAGIGVRIAIYLQNLLCFIPALWAIWDGKVSDYELESAETHSTTNLVLAFAILISCIVQALTLGLTNYHGSIVLSLSWMNNTNAFIYFLLYVQYRSQGANGMLSWSGWRKHIMAQAKSVLFVTDGRAPSPTTGIQKGVHAAKEAVGVLFKRIALLLGSLHLTLMAALGIWLWSAPQSFGAPETAACVTQHADIAVLGAHVPFGSEVLRIASLVIYSLFLLPGANLLLPMMLFLSFHCWYHAPPRPPRPRATEPMIPLHHFINTETSPSSNPDPDTAASSSQAAAPESSSQAPTPSPTNDNTDARARLRQVFPVYVGLGCLLIVNILFIADIELTLRRNAHLQAAGESEWGFGQILALLLVFMPLRDLAEALVRRRQEMQTKLDNALAKAINERNFEEMSRWIRAGAAPHTKADNNMTAWEAFITHPDASKNTGFISALHEAMVDFKQTLSDGHTALAKLIAKNSWDLIGMISEVDPMFTDGLSALQFAVSCQYWDGACTLVESDADVNTVFSDSLQNVGGRTLLQAACKLGAPTGFVQFLLENGADPNACGGDTVSDLALHTVCRAGRGDLVSLLLQHNAKPNERGENSQTPFDIVCHWKNNSGDSLGTLLKGELEEDTSLQNANRSTILHKACSNGEHGVVEILLQHGIDINARNKQEQTPLHQACQSGHSSIVQLLLDKQADATLKDMYGNTVLHDACRGGEHRVVEILLRQGVGINARDGWRQTPLHRACKSGHANIVQLLLENQADATLTSGAGYTALRLAQLNNQDNVVEVLRRHGVKE